MIQYSVGMSLGPSSSVESGVAVREIATGKLIYVDKLFSMSDVQLFLITILPFKILYSVFPFPGIIQ